jgi:hypothetical protein
MANKKPYKDFPYFDFCIQQFPFIAEDFDSLTMYELVSKLAHYVKHMNDEINILKTENNEMADEIVAIKEFIHMDDENNDENNNGGE